MIQTLTGQDASSCKKTRDQLWKHDQNAYKIYLHKFFHKNSLIFIQHQHNQSNQCP